MGENENKLSDGHESIESWGDIRNQDTKESDNVSVNRSSRKKVQSISEGDTGGLGSSEAESDDVVFPEIGRNADQAVIADSEKQALQLFVAQSKTIISELPPPAEMNQYSQAAQQALIDSLNAQTVQKANRDDFLVRELVSIRNKELDMKRLQLGLDDKESLRNTITTWGLLLLPMLFAAIMQDPSFLWGLTISGALVIANGIRVIKANVYNEHIPHPNEEDDSSDAVDNDSP